MLKAHFNALYLRPIDLKKAFLLNSFPDWLALSVPAIFGLAGCPQLGPPTGDAFVAARYLAFTQRWLCPLLLQRV